MKVRFRYLNPQGIIVFCSLFDSEKRLISEINTLSNRISKDVRAGKVINSNGEIFVFTSDQDLVCSSKRFKFFSEVLAEMVGSFVESQSLYLDDIARNTNRVIHNVVTYNAHSLQEIYSVLPQDQSGGNYSSVVASATEIVTQRPEKVAKLILKILKHAVSTKAEFSIYRKLAEKQPTLSQTSHVVHKVLMNALYVFFPDFNDKDVKVSVLAEPREVRAYFDYECLQIVFLNLLENATKYTLPNTNVDIEIAEEDAAVSLAFKMTSLEVVQDEESSIFDEGYSGTYSQKTGKSGRGIGLFIARRLVELNSGSLLFVSLPDTKEIHLGVPYQGVIFTIILPKNRMRVPTYGGEQNNPN